MRDFKFRAFIGNVMRYDGFMIDPRTGRIMQNMEYDNGQFVVPGHIMQSTGLKDCKGLEIFEGDILRAGKEDICLVGYSEIPRTKGQWLPASTPNLA